MSNTKSSKNRLSNIENPCRRYDRDDLWVQAFKNSNHKKGKKNVEIANEVDEDKLKNPYSVFFVKSTQETPETSTKAFVPKNEKQKQDVSMEKRKNRVKFRANSLTMTSKLDENVCNESIKNRNFEHTKRNRNAQSGCFCLRFYRMIIPISFGSISKYRSRINDNSSSVKKRSRMSLQKKKG